MIVFNLTCIHFSWSYSNYQHCFWILFFYCSCWSHLLQYPFNLNCIFQPISTVLVYIFWTKTIQGCYMHNFLSFCLDQNWLDFLFMSLSWIMQWWWHILFCYCFQIHPMGLCNDGDFTDSVQQSLDYGWVVVVKLELPQLDPDPCLSVYDKVSLYLSPPQILYTSNRPRSLSVCL